MEPRCEKCETFLERNEVKDSFTTPMKYHERVVEGYCPKCNTKYRWLEIYAYQRSADIEVIV